MEIKCKDQNELFQIISDNKLVCGNNMSHMNKIKLVRLITGCSLARAKEAVDAIVAASNGGHIVHATKAPWAE